jgi:hypothetical protein
MNISVSEGNIHLSNYYTAKSNAGTPSYATHSLPSLASLATLDSYVAILTPVSTPGVASDPIPNDAPVLELFLTISCDKKGMVGGLLTMSGLEDAPTVCQERRIGAVYTDGDWANITKSQLHMSLVVWGNYTPRFRSGYRILPPFSPARVLESHVRVLFPACQAISVYKVKGK